MSCSLSTRLVRHRLPHNSVRCARSFLDQLSKGLSVRPAQVPDPPASPLCVQPTHWLRGFTYGLDPSASEICIYRYCWGSWLVLTVTDHNPYVAILKKRATISPCLRSTIACSASGARVPPPLSWCSRRPRPPRHHHPLHHGVARCLPRKPYGWGRRCLPLQGLWGDTRRRQSF